MKKIRNALIYVSVFFLWVCDKVWRGSVRLAIFSCRFKWTGKLGIAFSSLVYRHAKVAAGILVLALSASIFYYGWLPVFILLVLWFLVSVGNEFSTWVSDVKKEER